jgi:predicted glycoside hydrolase/deacetylase ChbG (UPF0249 family)
MPNPALEKLGFAPDARVAIVHADDVGMCHAANAAFWEVQAFGIVTCGSVMMTCPWVPEMVTWCRTHPEADVGVHITLNSEWDRYRWGPLSTRDPKSGLLDDEGHMWRSVEELHRHMDPDAAIAEMRAQIEAALALGIDVTHIDTHMGAIAHRLLAPAYMQLALEYRIPAMLPRLSAEDLQMEGIDAETGKALMHELDRLAETGFPIIDHLYPSLRQGYDLEAYCRWLDSLQAGISHVRTHPSVPGYDLESISNSAPRRVADYRMFLRPELMEHVADQGIHLIGYRRLRDLIRGEI